MANTDREYHCRNHLAVSAYQHISTEEAITYISLAVIYISVVYTEF